MTVQKISDKIVRMTTHELRVKIEKYEWVLAKTNDAKERTVMVSVIDKMKNILVERINSKVDDTHKGVKIWKQIWTAENLDVINFRNEDIIPEARSSAEWKIAGENGKPAWCYYDNNPVNGKIYGKLYNWFSVNDQRNIAPVGWHVPTYSEWKTLFNDKGDENTLGGDLKETGTTHWNIPNEYALDIYGFKALPGGYRGKNAQIYQSTPG
jgi:uncharacterized protein (TIGR02145 family)